MTYGLIFNMFRVFYLTCQWKQQGLLNAPWVIKVRIEAELNNPSSVVNFIEQLCQHKISAKWHMDKELYSEIILYISKYK